MKIICTSAQVKCSATRFMFIVCLSKAASMNWKMFLDRASGEAVVPVPVAVAAGEIAYPVHSQLDQLKSLRNRNAIKLQ